MIDLRWLQPAPPDEPVLLGLLDEAERARAARFHHPGDRLAYAAAHALLRALLSEIGGGAPQDWRFTRTESGKPRLDETGEAAELGFSLSHARGLVACAVVAGAELGVDVEPLAAVPDALTLARTWFSDGEADRLKSLCEPGRSEAFLYLWTLKEAAHKAAGSGLQGRIAQPEFDPRLVAAGDDAPSPLHPSKWAFRCFRPRTGFVLSLASPHDRRPAEVRSGRAEVRARRLLATA